MRLQRLRLELRMELAGDEVGVIRQFDDLHISSIRRRTGNAQSPCSQRDFILTIELVAMEMAFVDFQLAVDPMRQSSGLDLASPGAQPHGLARSSPELWR